MKSFVITHFLCTKRKLFHEHVKNKRTGNISQHLHISRNIRDTVTEPSTNMYQQVFTIQLLPIIRKYF